MTEKQSQIFKKNKQALQNYLDKQLLKTDPKQSIRQIQQNKNENDFDLIERKLKALQNKLQKIRNQDSIVMKMQIRQKKYDKKYYDHINENQRKKYDINQEDFNDEDHKYHKNENKKAVSKLNSKAMTPQKNKLSKKSSQIVLLNRQYETDIKDMKKKSMISGKNNESSRVKSASKSKISNDNYNNYKQNNQLDQVQQYQESNNNLTIPSSLRKSSSSKTHHNNKSNSRILKRAITATSNRNIHENGLNFNNSTSIAHKRFIEYELQQFIKENIKLKNKVSELKGFEEEYWRMKEIFDKSEKLRKISKKTNGLKFK